MLPIPQAIPPASTLDELLALNDQQFICCVYQTLLKRTPDVDGFDHYLGLLRRGFSKTQILLQIRRSKEGKANDSTLQDLDHVLQRYQRGQYPLIGWLFRKLYNVESNHPIERRMRAIEQQIFLIRNEDNSHCHQNFSSPRVRLKLAYISPLPPERTGIADYSAELIPELSRYYEIDVIVAQETITDPWIKTCCLVRDANWFARNSHLYDRVLYHFGNSQYHQHMFGLLEQIPGVIVLHDFFLSGIVAHMDVHGLNPYGWTRELYHSHGYQAVQERFHAKDTVDARWKYPCNKTVIDNARGVIVHSDSSQRLAKQWLGKTLANEWSVIPLLRVPITTKKKVESRLALGIAKDAFIVCSVGILNSTKQNQRLLDAWLASSLSQDTRCLLIFIGENESGDYGKNLTASIQQSGLADRISITGWTNPGTFRQYLAAANMAVQLRTLSRGETSAAVLDCMNYGLPTIVNAHGSMADLDADAVWILPDQFEDAALTNALETLWKDEDKRQALGARAREVLLTQHSPRTAANQYVKAIESYYKQAESPSGTPKQPSSITKQLLIDISTLVRHDLKTGIERVVRSILFELLHNPPEGFRVEPVFATHQESGYRYARQFTLRFLNCPEQGLVDESVEVAKGDIFLGLDFQPHLVPQQTEFYSHLQSIGAEVYFVLYDLLPILRPDVFPEDLLPLFSSWLHTIAQTDGAICISRAVADDMKEWLAVHGTPRLKPFKLGWFHLGADAISSVSTSGMPRDAEVVLAKITNRPTFLMVGTIEPRKGYLQALNAFEELWIQGVDVNLVIVGNVGWEILPDTHRRTIPKTVAKIKNNSELNRRLFWLAGISDEYLEKIYEASNCLIAASEGEGFGLPLIEAAKHQLPIISRDIPVFREVAGDHVFYFSGLKPRELANEIRNWIKLDKKGMVPLPDNMPWLTWKKSSRNLLNVIVNDQWQQEWTSENSTNSKV
ncbi:MAG: glycosyltransferase [Solimicrobium sp.]|jgi:glycosyltransferase involved in cell wall biosynthesis|nr:glycosyltransferase [Solimicrobium sp.]